MGDMFDNAEPWNWPQPGDPGTTQWIEEKQRLMNLAAQAEQVDDGTSEAINRALRKLEQEPPEPISPMRLRTILENSFPGFRWAVSVQSSNWNFHLLSTTMKWTYDCRQTSYVQMLEEIAIVMSDMIGQGLLLPSPMISCVVHGYPNQETCPECHTSDWQNGGWQGR